MQIGTRRLVRRWLVLAVSPGRRLDGLDPTRIPNHIACVMDGNGRWATEAGPEAHRGPRRRRRGAVRHRRGRARARREVAHRLRVLDRELAPAGRRGALPHGVQRVDPRAPPRRAARAGRAHPLRRPARLAGAEAAASSRWTSRSSCTRAQPHDDARRSRSTTAVGPRSSTRCERSSAEGVAADKINDKTIAQHLYHPDMPDPDLMIRTSGEYRISNFLLWELAYSELVFTDVLWPDFRREHLVRRRARVPAPRPALRRLDGEPVTAA